MLYYINTTTVGTMNTTKGTNTTNYSATIRYYVFILLLVLQAVSRLTGTQGVHNFKTEGLTTKYTSKRKNKN